MRAHLYFHVIGMVIRLTDSTLNTVEWTHGYGGGASPSRLRPLVIKKRGGGKGQTVHVHATSHLDRVHGTMRHVTWTALSAESTTGQAAGLPRTTLTSGLHGHTAPYVATRVASRQATHPPFIVNHAPAVGYIARVP